MSNHIKQWLSEASETERKRVASEAGTSIAYLFQLSGGHRKASLELAFQLQQATRGKLTIAGLRPDLAQMLSQPAA